MTPDGPLRVAFVVGCARSGTSILGELIASHPDVRYVWEAHDAWAAAGSGPDGSDRLLAEHATPEVRDRLRRWIGEQQGSAALVVEKNPRNALRIPFLRAVFPEAKLIHIIRDGRDVACSLLPGIGGAEWQHLKPPSWRTLLAEHGGVVRCALAWKETVEIARQDLFDLPHLEVRYEHLVEAPRDEAGRIAAYLGLSEHPALLAFSRKIQDLTVGSYQAENQDRWYRYDHAFRVGRWRQNLDSAQKREVEAAVGDALAELGYR